MRVLLFFLVLLLAGCGGDAELAAAKAAIVHWKLIALVSAIVALMVGIALGSRGRS